MLSTGTSRFRARIGVVARAVANLIVTAGRRRRPALPHSILIAHDLLLGDTLCLTPLLAKCRAYAPAAEIVMTTPKALVPLYAGRPYGVTALPFHPSDHAATVEVIARGPYDLALMPAENRFAWLAHAARARWVVGFAGDRPRYKNLLLDEAVRFPAWPFNWADTTALLISGLPPRPFSLPDWPEPAVDRFDLPDGRYAVVHVGARNSLKYWPHERWVPLAAWLQQRGFEVVWSGGFEDVELIRTLNAAGKWRSYAGQLTLAQLWHLLKGATLFVSLDTGVVHLARIVGVPTVALFGPGSVQVSGAGEFWRESLYEGVTVDEVPCRDQAVLFKRPVPGMRRCVRYMPACTNNICMKGIGLDAVITAIERVLARTRAM